MKQLTGLDAAFLAMESPEEHLHIGSVHLLDPSTAPQPLTLQRLTEHLASRLHLVPLLRRKLRGVPFGLDQPYWVEEAGPSLYYHVRETALPWPGDDRQFALQVARLHARPMDLARPLWEVHLLTGLAGGRVAVYTKIHHSAMDGASGDDLFSAVLDLSPAGRSLAVASEVMAERPPGTASLLARSAGALLVRPARAARLGAGLLLRSPRLTVVAADRIPVPDRLHRHDLQLPHTGLRAPHVPFNAPISGQRSWAFADLSLEEVKQVKRAAGLTVNDVVMALSAGALRRWLRAHDALPARPLIAAVPVSVRGRDETRTFGNRFSAMLAALPTDVSSATGRLAAAGAAMRAAKSQQEAIPPNLLSDVAGLALPVLMGPGWRLATKLRLLERVSPFNLFISNVVGPRVPQYYAGALVLGFYPVSAIVHGQGLNITVMSYRDRLCFGLLACRELVPDLEQLAVWLGEELQVLHEAFVPAGVPVPVEVPEAVQVPEVPESVEVPEVPESVEVPVPVPALAG